MNPSRTEHGTPPPAARRTDHAVVIGAGMAGLAIAKALAEGFGHVTILDRDRLVPGHRRGTPQDRHLHLLLPAGADALEELLPGLGDDLVHDGAANEETDRIRVCVNGHRLAPARTGHRAIFLSRPFLESHVRRRVREHPAITVRERVAAVGLVPSHDGGRIVGVQIASPGSQTTEVLRADLVVDCSGRRSPLPRWLSALGVDPPGADELPVEVHYTTLRYRLPADALRGDVHVLVGPTPDGPIGGAMTNVEDGTWIVTLFAMAGQPAPTDVGTFERFAAQLPIDDIHAAIRSSQPVEGPARYRFAANRRRRYEGTDVPAGLLAAGDAVCTFNPIYGQGMSVAALQARALQDLLRSGPPPSPRAWFASIAGIIDTAWDMATGADLAVRAVQAPRDLPTRLANRYLARLHAAAAHDPALAARFLRVAGLIDPPTRLLHPATVARVLGGTLRPGPRPS
jgi:2-polyprenyl-6-methoxyphenol hydroxylase-like FAD-dependent oxidoreductase